MRAAVIGAGIAGLGSAWALAKRGVSTTIFESSESSGGVMASERREGYIIDWGPNTVVDRLGVIPAVAAEVGVASDIMEATDASRARFIVRDGRPVELPFSLQAALTTRALTLRGKLRLAREPFVPRGCGEESVYDFFMRRLGREAVDYLIDPLVSGVYAGDIHHLSAEHAFPKLFRAERTGGSIIRGMSKWRRSGSAQGSPKLLAFRGGMATFPAAIARALGGSFRPREPVLAIARAATKWTLRTSREDRLDFDAVVMALPAHALSRIEAPSDLADRFRGIGAIEYSPLAVVALGYHENNCRTPPGFGILFPSKEKRPVLGILFSSSLFPDRAPEKRKLFTCFVGGARHEGPLSEELACESAIAEMRRLFDAADPDMASARVITKAIPQYNLGHERFLSAIETTERVHPGLYFVGSYRGGNSVPETFANGIAAGERMAGELMAMASAR